MASFAKFRQRLFQIKAIFESLKALEWCVELYRHQIRWLDLRGIIHPTLIKASDERIEIVKDHYSASRFFLSIVASLAEREVKGGRFHVYCGILDNDGESLRFIAEGALRQLQDSRWMDYDDWQDRIDQIDERVRDAG